MGTDHRHYILFVSMLQLPTETELFVIGIRNRKGCLQEWQYQFE